MSCRLWFRFDRHTWKCVSFWYISIISSQAHVYTSVVRSNRLSLSSSDKLPKPSTSFLLLSELFLPYRHIIYKQSKAPRQRHKGHKGQKPRQNLDKSDFFRHSLKSRHLSIYPFILYVTAQDIVQGTFRLSIWKNVHILLTLNTNYEIRGCWILKLNHGELYNRPGHRAGVVTLSTFQLCNWPLLKAYS